VASLRGLRQELRPGTTGVVGELHVVSVSDYQRYESCFICFFPKRPEQPPSLRLFMSSIDKAWAMKE